MAKKKFWVTRDEYHGCDTEYFIWNRKPICHRDDGAWFTPCETPPISVISLKSFHALTDLRLKLGEIVEIESFKAVGVKRGKV